MSVVSRNGVRRLFVQEGEGHIHTKMPYMYENILNGTKNKTISLVTIVRM